MPGHVNCCPEGVPQDRREFLRLAASAAGALALGGPALAAEGKEKTSESLVKLLHESLSEKQKKAICFPWDHKDERGLLRKHISNNWRITKPAIKSNFLIALRPVEPQEGAEAHGE